MSGRAAQIQRPHRTLEDRPQSRLSFSYDFLAGYSTGPRFGHHDQACSKFSMGQEARPQEIAEETMKNKKYFAHDVCPSSVALAAT